MENTATVHDKKEAERRIPRGIRMAESLWEFVDGQAKAVGEDSASSLIERWVREKRDAVRKVA